MNDFFEQYADLYQNRYTLEAWIVWLSLHIQYFGYYICLYAGFLLLLMLCVLPFVSIFGLAYGVKIKIKHKKQKKEQDKLKHKVQIDYINTLDNFTKKKKKHK